MIELNLTDSAGAVRPLFQETVPDGLRLFSALNGHHPAIAWADAAGDPHWCVLRSGWFGRTFIGGQIEPGVLGLAGERLTDALSAPHHGAQVTGNLDFAQALDL